MTKTQALNKFKAFVVADQSKKKKDRIDPAGDHDWFDISLGFFAALGLSADVCHTLACAARYDHKYWPESRPVHRSNVPGTVRIKIDGHF